MADGLEAQNALNIANAQLSALNATAPGFFSHPYFNNSAFGMDKALLKDYVRKQMWVDSPGHEPVQFCILLVALISGQTTWKRCKSISLAHFINWAWIPGIHPWNELRTPENTSWVTPCLLSHLPLCPELTPMFVSIFSSEYYFSLDNLAKDFFLRRKMLKGGWLPVSLIASFHRVQALTQDVNFIIEVCMTASAVAFKCRFYSADSAFFAAWHEIVCDSEVCILGENEIVWYLVL